MRGNERAQRARFINGTLTDIALTVEFLLYHPVTFCFRSTLNSLAASMRSQIRRESTKSEARHPLEKGPGL